MVECARLETGCALGTVGSNPTLRVFQGDEMKEKEDKILKGVSFGFLGGLILGTLISTITGDFAFWLSFGVGVGLVFGSVFSLSFTFPKRV